MRVSPKTIQALTLFVADKKELRSYLRSINFESIKTKDVPVNDVAPAWLAVWEKK